jgi:hypothetical protein
MVARGPERAEPLVVNAKLRHKTGGKCHADRLALVDDPEAIALFDEHLLDAVAGVFPVLHVGIFLDHERAQVARVEHQACRSTSRPDRTGRRG